MIFPLSLNDRKSPQVSSTILSILADLNNNVVGIFFPQFLISKASNSFYQDFEYCSESTDYNWYHRHLLVS